MHIVGSEMHIEQCVTLYRADPPDVGNDAVALDEFGRAILCRGRDLVISGAAGVEVDKEAILCAVVEACQAIWPGRWGQAYKAVFDANPSRVLREMPPEKILRVLAWAASADDPTKRGAALIAAAQGVSGLDLSAARAAYNYSR